MHRSLLALALALCPAAAHAQICAADCDVVIEPDDPVLDAASGARICLRAGERGPLVVRGLEGTESAPLTLRACDGEATLRGTTGAVLTLEDTRYLRVDGAAMHIDGGPGASVGVDIAGCSEELEIDHLEVFGTSYTALRAHAEREACAVRRGLFIHHVHFHDVGGEGLFIGSNAATTPYRWEEVRIAHGLFERTGFQGLKLGQVGGAEVVDNVLVDVGIGGVAGEDSGMAFGAGTEIRAERNVVVRPAAWCVGFGGRDLFLANNVLFGCGRGVVINGASDLSERRLTVVHNTLVDVREEAFTHWSPAPPTAGVVANNLVVGSAFTGLSSGGAWSIEGNLRFDDVGSAGIVPLDPEVSAAMLGEAPLALMSSSPAKDAGLATSEWTVPRDFLDRLRDAMPDVGAHEEGARADVDAGRDAGLSDASVVDASVVDASVVDAGRDAIDASFADAGTTPPGGCAVGAAGGSPLGAWLVVLALLLSRLGRKRLW